MHILFFRRLFFGSYSGIRRVQRGQVLSALSVMNHVSGLVSDTVVCLEPCKLSPWASLIGYQAIDIYARVRMSILHTSRILGLLLDHVPTPVVQVIDSLDL